MAGSRRRNPAGRAPPGPAPHYAGAVSVPDDPARGDDAAAAAPRGDVAGADAGGAAVARIEAAVAAALARHGLRRAHVAFSAGPDSCALAAACATLCGPADVVLLHVDHGAMASAAAREHAAAWAAARGLALRVAAVTVPPGPSWEAQARRVRYPALAGLAPGELVMTAHTASDQAESVLLALARGTSPTGLRGIARRRGPWLRPLLDVRRADTLAACAARDLGPWADPMNDDPRFARVRVRREVLPALASLGPDIEGALCRLAAQAADHEEALAALAAPLIAAARDGDGWVCAALAAAPPAVARWVLAGWLRPQTEVGSVHVEAVRRLCLDEPHGSRGLDLPGLRVERSYDRLRVVRPRPAVALAVTGPDGPYRIRPWQPGDRHRPLRLRGRSRKVSDLFVDEKVPRAVRAAARVIEDASGRVVWVEHLGPAHGVTVVVTSST